MGGERNGWGLHHNRDMCNDFVFGSKHGIRAYLQRLKGAPDVTILFIRVFIQKMGLAFYRSYMEVHTSSF